MTRPTPKPRKAATTPTPPPASVVSAPVEAVDPQADRALSLDVEPRKPRLAWQGMDRRELVEPVPKQVVEIIRPRRAVEHRDAIAGLDVAGATTPRSDRAAPPNRLIWTNDNLVALRTLLDERDPQTGESCYRGRVDLVYIDPPFMVNSDFCGDNTIDIEIDKGEHVQAKKEPSLVEFLAYKDTWRQGLDSFLSMLRERLVLLKDLLAPTGSIYVHLDWHTVHYVKVLMDEIFGYDNFKNEITWRRTNARVAPGMWPRIHDTLLLYHGESGGHMQPELAMADPSKLPHTLITGPDGLKYQTYELTAPDIRRGETGRPWRGFDPNTIGRHWANPPNLMDQWDKEGLIYWPPKGGWPKRKAKEPFRIEDRTVTIGDVWADIDRLNQSASDRVGYPTQKPLALLERIISASCPPKGTVLDCFLGSGTTVEAAERLGRRWLGIDNSKYAIHVARKRLIHLHAQPKPDEKARVEYIECEKCGHFGRKEKRVRSSEKYDVRPFSVENMGVYQRAAEWRDFQLKGSRYRDEMMAIFGGEVVNQGQHLHGKKGHSWVHIGPLDGPVSVNTVWAIARAAAQTDMPKVEILSADYNPLVHPEREKIRQDTGVSVTIRIIPTSAINEVRMRLELKQKQGAAGESMAVPAFYTPLAIELDATGEGKQVTLTLKRCEVDVDSFLDSQRPLLKPVTEGMPSAVKKRAAAEQKKWDERQTALREWLDKAATWQKFVDFWAVDWDYTSTVGDDGKPIFETDWQSFRTKGAKGEGELVFEATYRYAKAGRYQIAARVTDVFGNDGIATVDAQVK